MNQFQKKEYISGNFDNLSGVLKNDAYCIELLKSLYF
jgi:hypothetical protein